MALHRLIALGLLCLAACLLGVGCGGGSESNSDGRLKVVATTGMIGDVAQRIVGDRAAVQTLMKAGIDPHLYKPTRSDLQAMQSADVVFYNGLLLEGKMTDTFARAADSGKVVRPVTEDIDSSYLLKTEGSQEHYDPHVWMDPTAWEQSADVIRAAMVGLDPDGAALYDANAEAVVDEIRRLDAYAESVLHSVPEEQRVLVTAHDAFNYFGRRYGYEVVGIQGLSSESEAGVRDIERIVDLLVEREIRAVFIESTINPRNVEALVNGAAARGHTVVVGGELFSDAMGPGGTYEGTYVGMIDHNVTTVARALGGNAPVGGMQEKLASE